MTAENVTVLEVADAPALKVTAKTAKGERVELSLAGIKPGADAAAARDELERAVRSMKGLRVEREGSGAGYLEYLAFQDKTGSVWVDLGRELVSMGLAVLDGRTFSRQAEYQHTARQAKDGVSPRYPQG